MQVRIDVKLFYGEEPCMSCNSHVAITKNAWFCLHSSFGMPQVPNDELGPANKVVPCEKAPSNTWNQANVVFLHTDTNYSEAS